ncbi:CNNM, transmembrane domain [Sesbania bispinosa]|nr:CNNM, transmembrane domain [Sesbania bispinosa]
MNVVSALMVTRMLTRDHSVTVLGNEAIPFGSVEWYAYAGISCFLVIFAGIMSGLTLGLMSLSLVDLEILERSGSPSEKKQAAVILPVVKKQHQLLVTLLLCNAVAMEALPIYLDKLVNQFVAIILSVTFVLFFGEVIPQAICSRRAQLKALVNIHSQEAGKGGELTHDETTIISGALDLTEKTAEEAMTPIESTFSLDVNSKLDWEAMGKILARGHSRVPVYSGNPKNIIGLLLVKSLLTVRPETETPVSAVSIRRIPRVPSDMPLYDILNEFQKGSSHMAAVVKAKGKGKETPQKIDEEKYEENKSVDGDSLLTTPLLHKQEAKSGSVVVDIDKPSRPPIIKTGLQSSDSTTNGPSSENIEDGEVIGIITLEDVFEELLQEEIVDETDEYVDVHKRIRVAAAAAASSVARAPSIRRLTVQKGAGGQSKPGQTPKKSAEENVMNSTR